MAVVISLSTAMTGLAQSPAPDVEPELPMLAAARTELQAGVGVVRVAPDAVPGPIVMAAPQAFALLLGQENGGGHQAVIAASTAGRGRAVALGHEAFLRPATLSQADGARLLMNIIRWTGAPRRAQGADKVGVLQLEETASWADTQNLPLKRLGLPLRTAHLENVATVLLEAGSVTEPADQDVLRNYLANGGGIVAAGVGWGWQQLHPGLTLANDYPGNRLLREAGLVWGGGTIGKLYAVQAPVPGEKLLNLSQALDYFQNTTTADTPDAQTAVSTLLKGLAALPDASPLTAKLTTLRARALRKAALDDQPLSRIGVLLLSQMPVGDLKPPTTAFFPGRVPATAPRIDSVLTVAGIRKKHWISTGLYAPPGEKVTIALPTALTGSGLSVRIGAHAYALTALPRWQRPPVVDRVFPLNAATVTVGNSFGGLIYLQKEGRALTRPFNVKFSGVVQTPRFISGVTDIAAWRRQVRASSVPWTELEGRYLIVTLQTEAARALDDPQALLDFWDRVQQANQTLAQQAAAERYPMRLVFDEQLYLPKAYMHSGYPIMGMLPQQKDFLRITATPPGATAWGPMHELGHNHQDAAWTFAGTEEVTVNLFTLHAYDTVYNVRAETVFPEFSEAVKMRKKREYLCQGASFDAWKADPFLALILYREVADAFGWEAYQRVFADYAGLAASARPRTDAQKRDQWLTRLSRATGRNLAPFFATWGIPVSPAAVQSVGDLPTWEFQRQGC
ncbi:MAG: M60 family metallopeptidase [Burkholderiaceae bacterium]